MTVEHNSFAFMELFSRLGVAFSNYSDGGQRGALQRMVSDPVIKTLPLTLFSLHSLYVRYYYVPHAHLRTRMSALDSSQYLLTLKPLGPAGRDVNRQ